jgi:single-strand DNA-binding protein
MYDTYVTLVGNLLTAPEWRRTTNTGSLVAHFRVASTARRMDRASGKWVDGNSLRVRVTCWRKLAEGAASSLMTGDPVIVVGRMYTRDWTDGEGQHRTLYELEAVAVGHDLSRGRARFVRNRPGATSAIEDAEAEAVVNGEPTEPVPDDEAPARRDDAMFEDEEGVGDFPVSPAGGYDPMAGLRAGFPPIDPGAADELSPVDPDVPTADELSAVDLDVPTGDELPEFEAPGGSDEPRIDPAEPAPTGRGRRSRSRATAGV